MMPIIIDAILENGLVMLVWLHIGPYRYKLNQTPKETNNGMLDDNMKYEEIIAHLARVALTGREQDVQLLLRRIYLQFKDEKPNFGEKILSIMRSSPTRLSPVKGIKDAIPVDIDSRVQLLRYNPNIGLEYEPIMEEDLGRQITQLVIEWQNVHRLEEIGLTPSKSVIFTGKPGVGKSMAAHWIARELNMPLFTLDLSAVMSSFLGRTGNNIRSVLEYAKSMKCILLLDEFDAIAKKRDDSTEVGELKRLVTVLLQEIDDWPSTGLIIAATNHPDLLDPAIWRRFDVLINFPMPDIQLVRKAVITFLGSFGQEHGPWVEVIARLFSNFSFSDIEREINRVKRALAINNESLEEHAKRLISKHVDSLTKPEKKAFATYLVSENVLSQRLANKLTGVSRDTIRQNI
ncbi:MAG: AAA family ATPase [Candidatus Neomarinimicrobiota bacterium]